MPVRGIRGAIDVKDNNARSILSATRNLLVEIQNMNPNISADDICSVIFTMTDDLNATFPAEAARELGWDFVPLLCAKELSVSEGLPKCIRVLIHWNTDLEQSQINHVYLNGAEILRPDLIS